MSLKAFHIFFIAVSALMAFGFGGWGVYYHVTHTSIAFLLMGLSSVVIGIGLIIYGRRFLEKFRHIGSL